ncbi:ribulose bisphosphate carboxylase large subunit protein (plasmid) [Rhizobium phaseoli]|uniref:ribulose-bisphosphate carboxylase large subunit family protein n=1 Tax=Rhizobium phaseoli TaxID=396 RepID=UPI0007EB9CB5|nr:ribulose-bisphosphate carboxylase large subunit family protein [Rhizobium phaseoli]ANL51022.1 ribulose bisphosphate carboxylase large subunit protein [Rhizobium phaseoli]
MHEDRFEADYLLETPGDPEQVADIIAGEQSSGTFLPVPGETPELKERSAARVTRLEVVETDVDGRSLASTKPQREGERVTRSRLTLSWPLANIGPSLPNLVATIAGNLFELRDVTGLRLLDLRLPPAFSKAYGGPRFGVEGTRRLSGVHDRPLIGTIIKPSIGLSAEATAELVQDLCEAGIDFIKDDELQSDGPSCPFDERVRAVMRVINDNADRTGKKVMYAFNLTGELDQMRRRHDLVLETGGTCVMASVNSIGLAGMIELGRFSELPIHGHRNGWGYMTRAPMLGWSYVAWQKLWRLAGADHMHVNGLQNKFSEDDDSVIASARACLTPMFEDKPCTVMPVFSSGQTVRQAPGTYAGLGSTDLIVTAGGGIVAHPDGPGAGVRALRDAWDATVAGIAIEEHAKTHPALSRALEMKG